MGCTLQRDESARRSVGSTTAAVRHSASGTPEHVASSLTLEHVLVAARAAASKTLEDTVILDVGDLIVITDYFVIASGRNDRQVRGDRRRGRPSRCAQAGGKTGAPCRRPRRRGSWVLLDYGDFIVHVFSAEALEFYDLERLWNDAPPGRDRELGDLEAEGEAAAEVVVSEP